MLGNGRELNGVPLSSQYRYQGFSSIKIIKTILNACCKSDGSQISE